MKPSSRNFFEYQKGGYPIIFASNVFHNSHLIQKCVYTAADFVYTSESNERCEKHSTQR